MRSRKKKSQRQKKKHALLKKQSSKKIFFTDLKCQQEKKMTGIAISGAGISGAFLYRLLRKDGASIDVYDVKNKIKCGQTPCAWGTSGHLIELVEATGLAHERYILQQFDSECLFT